MASSNTWHDLSLPKPNKCHLVSYLKEKGVSLVIYKRFNQKSQRWEYSTITRDVFNMRVKQGRFK